ncbi:MAG: hypothetical protein JOZ01_05335 [Candidatus Eremiobacteraeota bacterium]|nr:hypothetical protein [Candidatus Eremiobacteraeota bacterium]
MEQPLEFLKEKIPDFPGYDDDVSRWRSDELVRSCLGEAVADLQLRLQPLDESLAARAGDLLLRLGFANQSAYKSYEDGAHATFDLDALVAADCATVELAERAPTVDAAPFPPYLDDITSTLDRRDAIMSGKSLAAG